MDRPRRTYREMLRDPRWQRLRLRVFERDGWACTACGATRHTLNVHHLRYVRGRPPWGYPDRELVTLCDPCHERVSRPAALPRAGESLPAVPVPEWRRLRPRAGCVWRADEDGRLLAASAAGVPLADIGAALGRGVHAVAVRLYKLGGRPADAPDAEPAAAVDPPQAGGRGA